ncbi:MAG: thymidine phosphorylase [Deinococcales bacterium]|nr:thymidine phosphorylase [Deinococcales bacterium]
MDPLRPVDLILAKRAGQEHAPAELTRFIDAYVAGEVPDYQVAAWLMAVCWRGMTDAETAALTQAMARSGDMLDLSGLPHTVDKHSTGGVGDKTTLVLAPLLAAMGGTVAKMSGRGLGHTGGTVDKLESIPGFRSSLSDEEFLAQARAVGVVVTGQSKDLAPADGLLYALRDATGTVESLPLIASSIMSKKLAGGANAIVLDVKVGAGAFMKTLEEARELARAMTAIGGHAGREVRAVLSDMSAPLGRTVGNAIEVEEAVRCLRGEGPDDLRELCLVLAGEVLAAAGLPHGRAELEDAIGSGRAYERFERWVAAQGGDPRALGALERAPDRWQLRAARGGVVSRLDALAVGRAVGVLGGGRSRKGEAIDMGVGAELHAKVGEPVSAGEPLATLYHRGGRGLEAAQRLLTEAYAVGDEGAVMPLVLERGIGA